MNTPLQDISRAAHGCLSHRKTKTGRRRFQPQSDFLDVEDSFVKDERKIVCSKSFRLLSAKTQVATMPMNSLIRNRMTHTMEVVACAVTISDIVGLNTSLVRAIALGHDIGHVPFGHQGEHYLADILGKKEFCHEIMGPIVAQKIERQGRGLNLTFETLEGMMRHSGNTATESMSQEAWVVRYADKIAYIFADYNDMVIRMRLQVKPELKILMNEFGANQRERVMRTIGALVLESQAAGKVQFDKSDLAQKFAELRRLMYQLYPRITEQDPRRSMGPVFDFLRKLEFGDPFLLLALMTDRDVVYMAAQSMMDISHLHQTAIGEILSHLEQIGTVDLCDPCLSW